MINKLKNFFYWLSGDDSRARIQFFQILLTESEQWLTPNFPVAVETIKYVRDDLLSGRGRIRDFRERLTEIERRRLINSRTGSKIEISANPEEA